jgi:hypothetical protein
MSLEDEEKRTRAILKAQAPTSTEAIDAKKKRMEADRMRESLFDERRLLLDEWDRIQERKVSLKESKLAADPFLKRSIEARETAIRTRLAQIDEALNALNKDPGAGQP